MAEQGRSIFTDEAKRMAEQGRSIFTDEAEVLGVNTDQEWDGTPVQVQMKMRHPAAERFHELLREIGELHDAKQADYGREGDPFANVRGSSEWGVQPWVGALIRGTVKLKRLQQFARSGTLKNEGVADSMKDLAVYALIALVLFEQTPNE